jgi:hypothetical protein
VNKNRHLILLPLAHVILVLSPGVAVQGKLHARDLFPYRLQRMELDVCSPQRLPQTCRTRRSPRVLTILRRRRACLHRCQGEQPRGEIGIVVCPSWATSTLGSWPAHPLLLGPCCRTRRKRTNRPWPGADAKVNRRILVCASEAQACATVPKRTQRAVAIQPRAARAPDIAARTCWSSCSACCFKASFDASSFCHRASQASDDHS